MAASTISERHVQLLAGHGVQMTGCTPRDASLSVWVLDQQQPELLVLGDMALDGRCVALLCRAALCCAVHLPCSAVLCC